MPTLEQQVRSMQDVARIGSENALGQHLADLMGGRGSAVFDRDEFRCWDDNAPGHVLVPKDELARAAAAYEGKKYIDPDSGETKTIKTSSGKTKGIIAQAAVELARPDYFNDAVLGAAFRDRFVRVEGNNVLYEPHRRDHRVYAEHVRPYDLVPLEQVNAPIFRQFLESTWADCPDYTERVTFLLEYIGAAMLRVTWRHKANPLFVGAKDSGKSVMLSAVRACFPPGTVASVTLQDMGKRFGLSPLIGASVNLVTELPAAALKATEKAKGLLVGDPVNVEAKYRTPFPFRCTIGHMFAGNELPAIADDALRERFVVLDFPNVIPATQQDKYLPDKIAAEAQAIASCAIHMAAQGVVARGDFIRPTSSAGLSRGWAMASDNVASWAAASIEAGRDEDFKPTADLHAVYVSWCSVMAERPVACAEFGRRMARMGFPARNRGARGYLVRYLTAAEGAAVVAWTAQG